MDYAPASVVVPLLIVVGFGAIGAVVGSVYGARQEAVEGERSPLPYIGFVVGAVVGVASAVLWQL